MFSVLCCLQLRVRKVNGSREDDGQGRKPVASNKKVVTLKKADKVATHSAGGQRQSFCIPTSNVDVRWIVDCGRESGRPGRRSRQSRIQHPASSTRGSRLR